MSRRRSARWAGAFWDSTNGPRPSHALTAYIADTAATCWILVVDTRFGSSNVAQVFASPCNNRTCGVSSPLGTWQCRNSHRPSSERTFRVDAP